MNNSKNQNIIPDITSSTTLNKPLNQTMPPLIDLHLHAGWTDFDRSVQEKRSEEEVKARIQAFLCGYREAGITLVRDAGGYPQPRFAEENAPATDIPAALPIILPNTATLNGSSIHDAGALWEVAESPYPWTKIFITGGVGMSPNEVLTPNATKTDFLALVTWLKKHDKKIMVHCYGGTSLDWCIEAGVDTVEHAVYMTGEQAEQLAEKQIALIPTTAIYRLLAEKPELFQLPMGHFITENAKAAAESHLKTVSYAKAAGVCIGFGTDFYADPALLPYARYELETLQDCGLTAEEAVKTGTENAKKILC